MGYTPKHAKPVSVKDAAPVSRRNGLFAISEPRKGRHTATSGARQNGGTAAPEMRAPRVA